MARPDQRWSIFAQAQPDAACAAVGANCARLHQVMAEWNLDEVQKATSKEGKQTNGRAAAWLGPVSVLSVCMCACAHMVCLPKRRAIGAHDDCPSCLIAHTQPRRSRPRKPKKRRKQPPARLSSSPSQRSRLPREQGRRDGWRRKARAPVSIRTRILG